MPLNKADKAGNRVGRGVVQQVQFLEENALELNVIRFQLDRKDSGDEQLGLVPVEMRSRSFSGTVDNGDWVEIEDSWAPGEICRPKKVKNLTTKVTLRGTLGIAHSWQVHPRLNSAGCVVAVIILGAFIAGAAYFTIAIVIPSLKGDDVAQRQEFSLSSASAALGADVTASGSGWDQGETVVFRLGPEEVGRVVADQNGTFSGALITIPGDASPVFKSISATGEKSIVTRERPFHVLEAGNP